MPRAAAVPAGAGDPMNLPLEPPLLVALAIAVVALVWLVGGLVDEVTATSWPRSPGPSDRDERGRDARLEHVVRLLHASTLDEAHRTLVDLVDRRLDSLPAESRAAFERDLNAFLRHPPTTDREAYLSALEAALDRIERL